MQRSRFLIVGGVLMALLGLARGAGGLVLLTRGAAADPNIQGTGVAIKVVGALLVLLGAALVVAAAGIIRRLTSFWLAGMICTVAFVVDGAINGYLLYGRPGDRGTVINAGVAALILACLLAGKVALRRGAVHQRAPADAASRSR